MPGVNRMSVALVCALAAGGAAGQSAVVGISGPASYTPGDLLRITITLDAFDLSTNSLGLAGWNIAVDVDPGLGTIVGANYVTATSPLIDQNNPFGGDPTPEVSGNTVNFSEGLNAFSPANAFHNGGALAEILIDTTGAPGAFDEPCIISRKGDSPLGAFTEALPGSPPFSYVGVDFEEARYGQVSCIPTPGTLAVLAAGGFGAIRRRRPAGASA